MHSVTNNIDNSILELIARAPLFYCCFYHLLLLLNVFMLTIVLIISFVINK